MHPSYKDHCIFYTKNKSLHPMLSLGQKDFFLSFLKKSFQYKKRTPLKMRSLPLQCWICYYYKMWLYSLPLTLTMGPGVGGGSEGPEMTE